MTTGTVSAAPLAALATVAFTPTARSFGTTTRMRAERVRAAQARAQVVRVGDAVEHQQQRRLGGMLEHVGERYVRHRGVDGGDDALVTLLPRELVEPALVDRVHANAGDLRALDQIAHAADRAAPLRRTARAPTPGADATAR